jgi:PTS system N-acetylgalactosamine-specific IIA component
MVNILIAGHGRFASGLLSSLELIMGKQEYVCAVDFPQEDTKAELDVKIQAALTRVSPSDEVIVFCDLRGGSPFQSIANIAVADKGVYVVYGVNLPMIIEAVSQTMDGATVDDIVKRSISSGTGNIGMFSRQSVPEDTPSDFDD